MESADESFRAVSNEDELQRAKWFKEDLEKGEGWSEAAKGPGYTFWIKTFPDEKVPVKVLLKYNLPFSVKDYSKLADMKNVEIRKEWDASFFYDVLKAYPDGGHLMYVRSPVSWPLTDRFYVLYYPPATEVDWYGKQALFHFSTQAWHPSKPEGGDGLVLATHGGNFTVVTPDEDRPESACQLFFLTNNNYNGWLPKRNIEFILKRVVTRAFTRHMESMIEGYNRLYKNA